MASVTWLILGFVIFWLLTTAALIWLFLKLLSSREAQAAKTLELQQNLFETQLEEQTSLFNRQLEEQRQSSQGSLTSALSLLEDLRSSSKALTSEAVKTATFGISSANESLTKLMQQLIPILAAKEPMAAGQLSSLTAPAEDRSEMHGVPYPAESEAVLAQIDEAMNLLQERGITDGNLARTTAASVLLPEFG